MAINLLTCFRSEKKTKTVFAVLLRSKGKKTPPNPKKYPAGRGLAKTKYCSIFAFVAWKLRKLWQKTKKTLKIVTFYMAQNKAASPVHHAQANQRNRRGMKLWRTNPSVFPSAYKRKPWAGSWDFGHSQGFGLWYHSFICIMWTSQTILILKWEKLAI